MDKPDDQLPTAAQEELYESLLIAYDEALARGEAPSLDETLVPAQLQPRLRAALACMSLLARTRPPSGTLPQCDSHLSQAANTPLKPTIGRFDLLREIGRGGHGVVFLAVDPRLRRLVALKVPRPEVLVTPDLHRRFLREGRAASLLAHPNLVPIFEVGDDGPLCYIAAGYCEGPSLAKWLKQQSSPLPPHEAAALVARLADATAHAHARGIVHRDIKPANILLAPADAGSSGATPLFGQLVVPCLTDFGLARLIDDDASERTRTGTMLGTPAYMAPEQADGRTEDVGPATDVYALGAVLYELLVGRAPFRGANDLETLRLVSAAELARLSTLRPGLPRDLEAICLKALARSTGDRYSTAEALAADLRRFIHGEPTDARPLGKLQRTVRSLRRRPVRAALTAVILLLIVVLAGGRHWYSQRLAASLEASRQADRRRDELGSAVSLRSAWQAFNSDNAAQARTILRSLDADQGAAERGFAWQLLRNLTEDAELLTLRGHTGDVYHVVFSPDGASLATASQDRTVRIWDAATGKSTATLAGHSDEVNAVAWSPDGRFLASASDDGTVRLWDAQAHVALKPVLEDDRGPIVSLAFSHDGALLASGDDRGRVVLTDATTWQTAKTIETGGGRVDGLALTHDGAWLATATESSGVQIWDLSDRQPALTSHLFHSLAHGVAFDRGDRLLACGYRWAYYWDWQAGDEPRQIYGSPDYLNSIAFCGEDRLAVTAGQDGAARVVDPVTGELRQTLLGHAERIWCVANSPDSWRVATASADDTVKLWTILEATPVLAYTHPASRGHVANLTENAELLTLKGHAADVYEVVFSPDGASLATASQDRTVRIWDAATGKPTAALAGHSDEVNAVAWSPDGRLLASASDDGTVRLWDARTHVAIEPVLKDGRGPIASLAFSGDGALLASGDERGRVVLTNTTTWKTAQFVETGRGRVHGLALTHDRAWLATATEWSGARIWDLSERHSPLTSHLFHSRARGVAIDRRGRLACCGFTWAYYWNWQADDEPRGFGGSPDYLNSIAFCGDDRLVVVAAQDGAARVFDPVTGELRQTLLGHAERIWCVAASPDGWRVATASADDTAKLWTIQESTSALAYTDPPPLYHVAFASDGRTLIAAGDSRIERWRLRPVRADTLVNAWQLTDHRSLTAPPIAAHDRPQVKGGVDRRFSDLALSPDGTLAATCRNGCVGVSLTDLHTDQEAGALVAQPDEPRVQTNALAFSPDGRTLVEAVGRSLRLWNVAARRIERRMTISDRISAIAISPDGRRLAVAMGERLELWGLATRERLAGWPAHGSAITALAFSPGGLLASASMDRSVRLWSGTTGEAVATFSGHTIGVGSLSFSPDGRLLASGAGDEVKLWSLLSFEELATLKGFPGGVHGLAFSPTHLILAAIGGSDEAGHLRLWCAAGPDATWRPLTDPDAAVAKP